MQRIYKLFIILHKWKWYYVLSSILLIISTIFRMIEPKVLQVAIDGVIAYFETQGQTVPAAKDFIAQTIYDILPQLELGNLEWVLICLGLMYLVIALIRGLSMFASSAISAWCTEKATKRLRDNLFRHIQRLPLSYHAKLSTGEMIQRCTGDVETVKKFIGTQVVEVVLFSSIFFFAFYMMASVHLTYALIAISIVPFIFMMSVLFFKKEKKVWEEHEAEQDKLISMAEENLGGIRVVQAFAQEEEEIQAFENQNIKKRKIGLSHVMLHAYYWTLSDTLFHIQVTLSIFMGGYYTLSGAITVGELVSFYTYMVMVSWPMRRVGQVVSKLGMAFVAIDRLSEILDAEAENYEGESLNGQGLKGEIEFRNVSFAYPGAEDKLVLKNVSFKVMPGEIVALMGPTGSGKSTIIALLARFYEPTEGAIFIDGHNIKDLSKSYLRDKIGIVLQKAFLFSTTIKNNIAYVNPLVEEHAIVEAAEAAHIHGIMHVFPEGYDTIVGEKGVTLSGGQKQRVTLARTLLEDPDVLVLDDATSAVDTETEYGIQQALNRHLSGKTTFIIAHRMTSIQHATQIIVLNEGKVAASGNHEELLNKEGFYKEVYQVQAAIEGDLF